MSGEETFVSLKPEFLIGERTRELHVGYTCDHVDVALAHAYWVTPLNLNSLPFENYIWKLYRNSIISRYCVVHSTLLYILPHVFDVSEISFTQFASWLDVHVKIDLDGSCFPLTLTIMNLARD